MRWLAAWVVLFSLTGHAAEFSQIQAAKSSITFVGKQMGSPVEGKFGKFNASISFDPDNIAANKAHIEIDMASIDVGDNDTNDELKDKDWFNIKQYPAAKFDSTGIKAMAGGRYETSGKMTIKGVTRNVAVLFTAKVENNLATLDGGMTILRLQYGVGTGEWADTYTVADEVQLHFRFVLEAAKK